MSMPSSVINICSGVRLNNKYEHTIYFDNANNQLSFFAGKVVKTFSAYSYLRKSWSIKVDATMESAKTWSYLYFRNATGKTYYYFITNIEYINDNTVELSLELDVMQTYMFDYSLLRSYVEREHVSTDAIGEHIVDEGLELGDLRVIDETVTDLSELCLLVMCTFDPIYTTEENTETVTGRRYDNIFYGVGIYAVEYDDWLAWGQKLKLLDEYGKSDGVMTMWVYPKSLITLAAEHDWGDGEVTKAVKKVDGFFHAIARNSKTSGGYEPRNNKLLTYPFNFLYVTNNSGNGAVYRYERFGDFNSCNFKVVGCMSPEGSVKMYPLNYNGVQHNYEEGLVLGNFPTCAWNQDTYKLWLAQNQNQQNFTIGVGALKMVGGLAATIFTGGLGGVVGVGTGIQGATEIANLLQQRADKELMPPQAKGSATPSVNVANGFHHFTFQRKSLGIEMAQTIDDFFDLYGYKINRVKIPNRKVRENWTYTKTIGCHITGNLCNDDLTKIESIYNNGITFWVNGNNIGNYSLSNNTL